MCIFACNNIVPVVVVVFVSSTLLVSKNDEKKNVEETTEMYINSHLNQTINNANLNFRDCIRCQHACAHNLKIFFLNEVL